MLSIQECRKYFNQKNKRLSDEEVKILRDFLYQLAKIELLNFKATTK
jgi:hypothetical protein